MWIESEGKNENKNWLVGVFYQPRPEDKEKLEYIQKLDTILSIVTTTLSKTVIITGHTRIDYNKLSTVLESYNIAEFFALKCFEMDELYNIRENIKKAVEKFDQKFYREYLEYMRWNYIKEH